MIKLKDLIIETWNSNIWKSDLWNSHLWNSNIWNSDIWNPGISSHHSDSESESEFGDLNETEINQTYGHWISTDCKMIDVDYSHEVVAREIIQKYIDSGKLSPEEIKQYGDVSKLRVSDMENFLFGRGWIRGVTDIGYYYVNGKPNQRLTSKQRVALINYGIESKKKVEFRTRGGDVFKGTETIYDPYETLE